MTDIPTRACRCSHRVRGPRTAVSPHILRKETVGGGLLLLATVIALVWANTPLADSYFTLLDTEIGPAALHLNLTLAAVGRRRVVGDLLLRRRAGTETGIRRRRPTGP